MGLYNSSEYLAADLVNRSDDTRRGIMYHSLTELHADVNQMAPQPARFGFYTKVVLIW